MAIPGGLVQMFSRVKQRKNCVKTTDPGAGEINGGEAVMSGFTAHNHLKRYFSRIQVKYLYIAYTIYYTIILIAKNTMAHFNFVSMPDYLSPPRRFRAHLGG
jgi:hypothetical protein